MIHISTYKRVNGGGIRVKVKLYFDEDSDVILFIKLLLLDKSKTEYRPEEWKDSIKVKETQRYILFFRREAFYGDTFAMIVNDLINSKLLHPRNL